MIFASSDSVFDFSVFDPVKVKARAKAMGGDMEIWRYGDMETWRYERYER